MGFVPGLLPFRMNKDVVLEWGVVAFIALLIKNRWLGGFILWFLISQIINVYTPVVGLNKAFILQLHTVVIFSFFYYLLFENVNKKNVNKILDIIAATCLIQILMMLLQYNGTWIGIMPLYWQRAQTAGQIIGEYYLHPLVPIMVFKNSLQFDCPGFLDMVNTSSGYLAMCLPAFFRKKWHWGIPFVFAGLWISRSLGGLLPAIIITFFYVVVKQRRYLIPVLLGLVLFVGGFFWKYERITTLLQGTGRVDLWTAGLRIFKKRWVVGWGAGQSSYLWRVALSLVKTPAKWVHYHNEYLNLMIELGSIGLVIFIGYITDLFIKIKRNDITFILVLGILAGLMNCFVNFTMHGSAAIILITYLAMADGLTRGE